MSKGAPKYDHHRARRILHPVKRTGTGGVIVGTSSVRLPRKPKFIVGRGGELVPSTSEVEWFVCATKPRPWTVRAKRRAANRVARRSRKINSSGKS